MLTVHTNRMGFIAIAVLLAGGLVAPVAAQVPDPDRIVVAAPAGPTWDETSGYGAVEANRTIAAPDAGDILRGSVVSRATDIGSMQEEYLAAAVAARLPITNQVSADVRWAPTCPSWNEASGYRSIELGRAVMNDQDRTALFGSRVSRASDIGSMQEEYLAAPPASSWDETTGYGVVEANRAAG